MPIYDATAEETGIGQSVEKKTLLSLTQWEMLRWRKHIHVVSLVGEYICSHKAQVYQSRLKQADIPCGPQKDSHARAVFCHVLAHVWAYMSELLFELVPTSCWQSAGNFCVLGLLHCFLKILT